jgi:predicted GIY-YIG superfamily endonuclease
MAATEETDYSGHLGTCEAHRLMNLGGMLPMDAGRFCVYALWFIEEIVYVGYTEDLPRRIAEHRRGKHGRIDMIDGYTFVPFKRQFDALEFERRMILALNPYRNKQKYAIDMGGRPL